MGRQRHNRSTDAGRLAICESGASHLEHVYTDREFGGNFSGPISWVDRLDGWRNHRLNHVPIGLHLDLLDNAEPVISDDRFGGGSGAVIDNVIGLTNGQLFSVLYRRRSSLGPTMTSCRHILVRRVCALRPNLSVPSIDAATDDPQVYRQRIINDLLPGSGIAVGDVDALFNSY